MNNRYFKIRHKITGLYSNGYMRWNKSGKLWTGLGPLRMFLNRVISPKSIREDVENWEILEIELVVKSSKTVSESLNPNKIVELLKR